MEEEKYTNITNSKKDADISLNSHEDLEDIIFKKRKLNEKYPEDDDDDDHINGNRESRDYLRIISSSEKSSSNILEERRSPKNLTMTNNMFSSSQITRNAIITAHDGVDSSLIQEIKALLTLNENDTDFELLNLQCKSDFFSLMDEKNSFLKHCSPTTTSAPFSLRSWSIAPVNWAGQSAPLIKWMQGFSPILKLEDYENYFVSAYGGKRMNFKEAYMWSFLFKIRIIDSNRQRLLNQNFDSYEFMKYLSCCYYSQTISALSGWERNILRQQFSVRELKLYEDYGNDNSRKNRTYYPLEFGDGEIFLVVSKLVDNNDWFIGFNTSKPTSTSQIPSYNVKNNTTQRLKVDRIMHTYHTQETGDFKDVDLHANDEYFQDRAAYTILRQIFIYICLIRYLNIRKEINEQALNDFETLNLRVYWYFSSNPIFWPVYLLINYNPITDDKVIWLLSEYHTTLTSPMFENRQRGATSPSRNPNNHSHDDEDESTITIRRNDLSQWGIQNKFDYNKDPRAVGLFDQVLAVGQLLFAYSSTWTKAKQQAFNLFRHNHYSDLTRRKNLETNLAYDYLLAELDSIQDKPPQEYQKNRFNVEDSLYEPMCKAIITGKVTVKDCKQVMLTIASQEAEKDSRAPEVRKQFNQLISRLEIFEKNYKQILEEKENNKAFREKRYKVAQLLTHKIIKGKDESTLITRMLQMQDFTRILEAIKTFLRLVFGPDVILGLMYMFLVCDEEIISSKQKGLYFQGESDWGKSFFFYILTYIFDVLVVKNSKHNIIDPKMMKLVAKGVYETHPDIIWGEEWDPKGDMPRDDRNNLFDTSKGTRNYGIKNYIATITSNAPVILTSNYGFEAFLAADRDDKTFLSRFSTFCRLTDPIIWDPEELPVNIRPEKHFSYIQKLMKEGKAISKFIFPINVVTNDYDSNLLNQQILSKFFAQDPILVQQQIQQQQRLKEGAKYGGGRGSPLVADTTLEEEEEAKEGEIRGKRLGVGVAAVEEEDEKQISSPIPNIDFTKEVIVAETVMEEEEAKEDEKRGNRGRVGVAIVEEDDEKKVSTPIPKIDFTKEALRRLFPSRKEKLEKHPITQLWLDLPTLEVAQACYAVHFALVSLQDIIFCGLKPSEKEIFFPLQSGRALNFPPETLRYRHEDFKDDVLCPSLFYSYPNLLEDPQSLVTQIILHYGEGYCLKSK